MAPRPRDPPAREDVFRALSHPARRLLVERLAEGDAIVEELVDLMWDRFRLTPSSTSNHLQVLLEAGIVVGWARAPHRAYALRPRALDGLRTWVLRCTGGT